MNGRLASDSNKSDQTVVQMSQSGSSTGGGNGSKYSIILPTYNERRNLPVIIYLLCTTLEAHKIDYEIIIVDDASPDGTLEIAKQLQGVWGPEHIVLRPRTGKLGLGTAYVHGLESCTGDFVFIMDADFSHHPKDMPKMIQMQRERNLDIVQGTRYSGPSTGAGVYGWNLKRKLVSRGANLLASVFLDPKTTDVTGSFRLYRRPLLHRLMKEATSKGYVFQMEILVRAKHAGATIGEVPITFCDRVFGDSKLEGGEIVGYAKGVWNLWRAF
ncbi:hypothetical protein BCV69DRAFT_287203 [Microstroma glucosiphilum]|uniref:Dolichol-phosphate mannosyltransferase subunit 1 n=1 Tax=Pseudomicrostroma glucosiphilum TaxID=1684307 RepID=A0A316U9Q4_9BASI|nr:hypothetical protein BCV69DRAFT_287203 [Pseudomicrostroma glucosiphilum]PWN21544.1 hypothetical protein BCV69DRAFT_287203 [Pseudomicrostroma glucosiphilum]